MKRTVHGITAAALAAACGASAYAQVALPELTPGAVVLSEAGSAAPAPAPAVQADAGAIRTMSILFDKKEQAEELLAKLEAYLGPRLSEKAVVDGRFRGFEMTVKYGGSPLSAWVTIYKESDAIDGFYYLGPRLDDARVKEYEERGGKAREEVVKYLETERTGYFFAKPKINVIWSYTNVIRVKGRDDRGKPIEIVSPFSYLFLDGALPEGVVTRLNRNRYMPFAVSK